MRRIDPLFSPLLFHISLFSVFVFLVELQTVKEQRIMGDIGYIMPQTFTKQELGSGWSFKQTDDPNEGAWLPVNSVPSTVQQDLLDHKK